MLRRNVTTFTITPITFALIVGCGALQAKDVGYLSPLEELGKKIYFDEDLSLNRNQACVTCHVPEVGFTGDSSEFNEGGSVYEGSVPGAFGNRKPPSAAYATLAPRFYADLGNRLMGDNDPELAADPLFVGGNFWDGRATGWELGNPAADQAQGPFTNPVEQALPDTACVVYRVCEGEYGELFDEVWSPGRCTFNWPANIETLCEQPVWPDVDPIKQRVKVEETYDRVALSIAAFEDSSEVNAFSSKIDAHRAGDYEFTEEEIMGRDIFRGKGKCVLCHVGAGGPGSNPPLFTDFTFDNLGVPRNPENPFSVANPEWRDPGLAGFLENVALYEQFAASNLGKSKVPTLRNVAKGSCESAESKGKRGRGKSEDCITKSYMHNGFFKSLKTVVHFYNTRDVKPVCEDLGIFDATEAVALANDCWPQPEVADNVNTDELGNLGLTEEEEDALVTWMEAMSDGFYNKRQGYHK